MVSRLQVCHLTLLGAKTTFRDRDHWQQTKAVYNYNTTLTVHFTHSNWLGRHLLNKSAFPVLWITSHLSRLKDTPTFGKLQAFRSLSLFINFRCHWRNNYSFCVLVLNVCFQFVWQRSWRCCTILWWEKKNILDTEAGQIGFLFIYLF